VKINPRNAKSNKVEKYLMIILCFCLALQSTRLRQIESTSSSGSVRCSQRM